MEVRTGILSFSSCARNRVSDRADFLQLHKAGSASGRRHDGNQLWFFSA